MGGVGVGLSEDGLLKSLFDTFACKFSDGGEKIASSKWFCRYMRSAENLKDVATLNPLVIWSS